MKDVFIKKKWDEKDVLFIIHFQNNEAARQIEISKNMIIYLSKDDPIKENSMLFDQDINDLEIKDSDYISQEEFEKYWSMQLNKK